MINPTLILFLTITALTLGTMIFLNDNKPIVLNNTEFSVYKSKFNKKYITEADISYRRMVYNTNMAYIRKQNAKGKTHTLGETPFSDMTFEEFKSKYLMKEPVSNPDIGLLEADTGFRSPANINWRTAGVVSQVKDQGQCGSCWAFSAIGSLESATAIKNKNLIEFSEQELIDCSKKYHNNGCNGGMPTYAFDYILANKISLESAYPYTGKQGTCNSKKKSLKQAITGYKTLKSPHVSELINVLNQQPVSVGIEVQDDFMHYVNGIYTPGKKCGDNLNHGVVAVGYNITADGSDDYFIVKNSWTSDWGENGYIRMAIGTGRGICGIANVYDAYPQV